MTYKLPADWPVTASWQSHKDRNPPSSEPGTDIGTPYGTVLLMPADATIIEVKTSNSGAMGRVVGYRFTDGRCSRSIHMAEIWTSVGQSLKQGMAYGKSGASGYNSDWYYGPHYHQTLWPGDMWEADTIDFMEYLDRYGEEIALEWDEMIRIQSENRGIALIGPGYFRHLSSDEEVGASDAIISKHVSGNDRQFDLWKSLAVGGDD